MNLRDLLLRVRALWAPRRVQRELDDEIAFHLERETHKHLAAGLSPSEAQTRALARFARCRWPPINAAMRAAPASSMT